MTNAPWRPLTVLALACALGAGCDEDVDPAPTVATASVIRGGFTLEREGQSERVVGEARVERGAEAVTAADGRGVVRLDSGAWLLFDRDTRATFGAADEAGPNAAVALARATLTRGRVWVDASSAEETTIEVPSRGSVRASNATFAISVGESGAEIYCGSGEITYVSPGGSDRLAQGERVVLTGSGEPRVEPADLWDDWTGGLADPGRSRFATATYLGVLAGRRLDEQGHARTALPIRAHEVNVRVRGDLARTEVEQTFFNARSDVLEGEYAIRLPRGAIVQSFAIDQGGGWQEAVVNAMSVGQGYELSWMGYGVQGAKLTYDGPDRLRARVHPITPGATVRVRLAYTEWLDRRASRRTYEYPMRVDGEPPLLGEFILQVDTSGTMVGAMRAGMGATVEGGRVVLRRSDFRPRADFYLDLYDPQAQPNDVATSYVVSAPAQQGGGPAAEGQESYVLFDLPTEALVEATTDAPPPLELVLLLDVSGETDPEDLEIARAVIEAVLRQVTPTDRVAIRLADVTARAPEGAPEGLVEATEENREALLESIARVTLGGATDLGQCLREAGQLVAGRPRAAVLYLGDGLPTTGALDATALRATLATLDAPPRYYGLAIGDGANLGLLRRLFDGHAEGVHERTEAARAVMQLLADAAQPTLRGVAVDLGENVERVYPRPPILVANGAHLRLVGRLVGEMPPQVTVRGHLDGQAFERTLNVRQGIVDDDGDVRRRWGQNRLAELIDEDAGREAMVDLGLRFGLVSPWTSLVVGGVSGGTVAPITGFDHDPFAYAWGLGGGETGVNAAELTSDALGWRRRLRREAPEARTAPEETWVSRVSEGEPTPAPRGAGGRAPTSAYGADGGLARASVQRALSTGERGPRGCYERRSIVRPDLAGEMTVEVEVGSDGAPRAVRMVRETLGDDDLRRCVETEIRGLRFPSTSGAGATTVTVQHTLSFQMPEREFGSRRQCSDASRQSLETRRALWRERLAANAGVGGALSVWREANAQCELGNWRARRTLLHMMLDHSGPVRAQVALYRAFAGNASIEDYLRRVIMRRVRSPDDVIAVRGGLGLDVPVDWTLFSDLWKRNPDPTYRLALVRRWLEVVPEEMDLRLRLLALLEQTGNLPEARRLARELRADPLADARVRTRVGEFWLRQEEEREARRVFSELVERTPLDPWARRRLGDLYRAHGWADDAYREYRTLSRLTPSDGAVLLLLARAAADAGRIDEALRLEQRLSESTDPGVDEGAAGYARLWTTVRLARLKLDADGDEMRAAVRRRERQSGALREPPALFLALTWPHPDDHPELLVRWPSTAEDVGWEPVELGGRDHGIYAARAREREEGEHLFEVRRHESDELRDLQAELTFIAGLGTADERVERIPFTLPRDTLRRRYRLTDAGGLTEVPIPANERR
ncbi:MAG: AgmX/PglI C-terminal domain-containing protein [Sandaracinaceae bacterium]|nr:AgmX/PglI C-terminal domain-containing protein [Sandaracinaceae bacterium]